MTQYDGQTAGLEFFFYIILSCKVQSADFYQYYLTLSEPKYKYKARAYGQTDTGKIREKGHKK